MAELHYYGTRKITRIQQELHHQPCLFHQRTWVVWFSLFHTCARGSSRQSSASGPVSAFRPCCVLHWPRITLHRFLLQGSSCWVLITGRWFWSCPTGGTVGLWGRIVLCCMRPSHERGKTVEYPPPSLEQAQDSQNHCPHHLPTPSLYAAG